MKTNGSGSCGTCCRNIYKLIKFSNQNNGSHITWCHDIYNIIYLQYRKCEIDHGHENVIWKTTIWLEVSDPLTLSIVVRLAIFNNVALALLS